jgi:FkbM family methyltransferase
MNIKNLAMYRPIRNWRIAKTVAKWNKSDDIKLAFYKSLIEPGSLVFDVGANIGKRTKIFLKLGARVVAVEPQQECATILHLAFHHKIELINKGLAAQEGVENIWIDTSTTLSSMSEDWMTSVRNSGRFKDHTWERKAQIKTTTLDRLIEIYGQPSFIKIDVEGFEYQVLKGLTRRVKNISIENTPERLGAAKDCIEYLCAMGNIVLNYSFGETMQWVYDQWVSKEIMIEFLENIQKSQEEGMGDIYIKYI